MILKNHNILCSKNHSSLFSLLFSLIQSDLVVILVVELVLMQAEISIC